MDLLGHLITKVFDHQLENRAGEGKREGGRGKREGYINSRSIDNF